MRFVGAERDGHGNRARPNGQGKGQREESPGGQVAGIHGLLNAAAGFASFFFVQHIPACGHNDQAAADLHYGERNPEKRQYVRADEVGTEEKQEAVDGDVAGKEFALDGGVVVSEGKENRCATERVDDGEERGDDQDAGFGDGEHELTVKKYSRRSAK